MSELEKIAERYKRRENSSSKDNFEILFSYFAKREREAIYKREILKHFQCMKNLTLLEIGAGAGANIDFFKSEGVLPQHIYANELLPERISQLRINHPDIKIIEGDACEIANNEKFDIVFQSTVFTSILDDTFKKKLAQKMQTFVKKDGILIWYDFIYNNPANKDVKGVSKGEILRLFDTNKNIIFFPVTLAPPIGRKVGRLYTVINSIFPFLRTHVIAIIQG